MRTSTSLFIVFCVLGTLSCTQSHDANSKKGRKKINLEIRSVYTFSLNSPELISRIHDHHGIKTDSKGEQFLFADKGKNQVLVTDSLGNVEQIIGQTGRGPKEFLSISSLSFINDEAFLVYDESLSLIKIFKVDGSLISSFRPSMDGYYFASPDLVIYDDMIYGGILEAKYIPFAQNRDYKKMMASKIIIAIDTSGNDIAKYGSYDILTSESKDYVQFSVIGINKNQKKVFVNQLDSPIIQVYDLEIGSFGIFSEQIPENFMRPKEFLGANNSLKAIKEKTVDRTYVERLVPLDEHLFKSIDKLTEEWNITQDHMTKTNILVVYDYKGNIVAEKVLEGKRLFGGHGNKLYFLTDNNPDNFTIEVATYRLLDK